MGLVINILIYLKVLEGLKDLGLGFILMYVK